MRVSVYKTRHHHAMTGVDYGAILSDKLFDLTAATDRFDSIAAYEERTVFGDGQLAQIAARAGPVGARQRDDL